jgi:acyl CoA:acetate/3-ketoacid CoA transferase alpha subunit
LVLTEPSALVMVGVPQASVAVAVPAAGTLVGLQPRSLPAGQLVKVGGVTSTVQVKTCVQVAVFPQPSVAVYVRVCDRRQPLVLTEPSALVMVGVPQASVAVAVPAAGTPVGLQPRSLPAGQLVNVGGVTSTVQVNTCVQVAVFPQPSVAVYVRVCERRQPLLVTEPSALVMVGVPQASVAVAVPAAGTPVGLQPRSLPAGQLVNVGGVTSTVQVKTCVQVAVFPQPSVAV